MYIYNNPSKKNRPADDTFMYLNEKFDQHKLNHSIKNEALYSSKMRVFDDSYNPFKIASKYLLKSRNGLIKTNYKHCPAKSATLSPMSFTQTLILKMRILLFFRSCVLKGVLFVSI